MFDEVRRSAPYVALERETFDRLIDFISTGGYALRAYDRFRRLRQGADGLWHVSHPRFVEQHRMNAGVIVDRSEEHTSELQSLMRISSAVFCLKKKRKIQYSDR